MEAKHGRALSLREQRALADIEQVLRTDEKLDRALSTMCFGRFFRWRREREDRERREPWPWG